MVGVGAMRKIQAKNVYAFLNKRNQDIVGIAGRANGGYDLGFIEIYLLHRLKNKVVFNLKRIGIELLYVLYQRYQIQFFQQLLRTHIG